MKLLAITAAALAVVAVPAAAVTVVSATSIRITSSAPDYLQVAEVQAFDFNSVNVARTGIADASSTYNASTTAAKAIDGNTGGNFNTDSIFHSQGSDANEFLEIAFSPSTLASLTIFGRSDCCSQRDIYNVQIFSGTNLLYSGALNADTPGHFTSVSFEAPAGGVPEPTTWAMLVAGFGLVGATARRRRNVAVVA